MAAAALAHFQHLPLQLVKQTQEDVCDPIQATHSHVCVQTQISGQVRLWLAILSPTWQGLEYGSYGSYAAADPEEGHARMTDAAEAVQEAAVQQGFQPRVQPSGEPVLVCFVRAKKCTAPTQQPTLRKLTRV